MASLTQKRYDRMWRYYFLQYVPVVEGTLVHMYVYMYIRCLSPYTNSNGINFGMFRTIVRTTWSNFNNVEI